MIEEKKANSLSYTWYIVLPIIGIFHKLLELIGWLEIGSWPYFLLFLVAPLIWIIIVSKETNKPFIPLLIISSVTGILVGVIEFIYWLNFREPLGLGRTGWSFDDLMTATNYALVPALEVLGRTLGGIIMGIITGLIAKGIVKFRKNSG